MSPRLYRSITRQLRACSSWCGSPACPGRGDHVGGRLEPLLDPVGAPQRDMAGVERGGERARVARAARGGDRLGAEDLRAGAVRRVVELDREPRAQQGGEGRGFERLLEPRDRVGVEVDYRDAEAGEPQRRLRQQRGIAPSAGEPSKAPRARRPARTSRPATSRASAGDAAWSSWAAIS